MSKAGSLVGDKLRSNVQRRNTPEIAALVADAMRGGNETLIEIARAIGINDHHCGNLRKYAEAFVEYGFAEHNGFTKRSAQRYRWTG